MFAAFNFDWPVAISKLFGFMSVFSLNVELLAPECNFAVNFEAKWFTIQLLPVILGAAIATVVAATRLLQTFQSRVLHVLPFGALAKLDLTDTCIGIFITGVFHLYLGQSRRRLTPRPIPFSQCYTHSLLHPLGLVPFSPACVACRDVQSSFDRRSLHSTAPLATACPQWTPSR
jgi:hypothetical protein